MLMQTQKTRSKPVGPVFRLGAVHGKQTTGSLQDAVKTQTTGSLQDAVKTQTTGSLQDAVKTPTMYLTWLQYHWTEWFQEAVVVAFMNGTIIAIASYSTIKNILRISNY